jgi:hypothetical protein
MRPGRTLALLGAALVAGLALWGDPARAAFPDRPDAGAAKAKLTKIKVIVGRSRNAFVGSVYSHKAGCVGARRARVFEVTGARKRLLDSGSSVRRGAIGYFRLALGRFKWNQTYRIVTAPRRAAGLRCEGDRQTYRVDCGDDAVLDRGRPTTNCYPLPEGPAAFEGTVTTTYVSDGLTQVLTGAVRLTRIANPGSGNVQGGLHEATLAYQTAPGTLNWTESGTSGSNGCVYQGSGQLAIGSEQPDAGAIPAAPVWARLVFELGTLRLGPGARYHVESNGYHYGDMTMTCRNRPGPGIDRLYPGWFDFAGSLYSTGSEFGPGIHAEAVRDDGTLGGVHSLEGIEGGGDNGSTARVEWSLRPAG